MGSDFYSYYYFSLLFDLVDFDFFSLGFFFLYLFSSDSFLGLPLVVDKFNVSYSDSTGSGISILAVVNVFQSLIFNSFVTISVSYPSLLYGCIRYFKTICPITIIPPTSGIRFANKQYFELFFASGKKSNLSILIALKAVYATIKKKKMIVRKPPTFD